MRRRLTLTTVVSTLVALLLVTAGVYVLLSRSLERDANAVLRTRAEAALATVEARDGALRVTDTAGDETLDATTWVLGPDGSVLLAPQSSVIAEKDVVALAGVTAPTYRDVQPESRLLAVPVPGVTPGSGTVVASLSLAPYEHSEHLALTASVALDVAIVLVLAVVTGWLVGAALRPVDEMTRQAQDWAAHDVDRRFVVTGPADDEIGRLRSTLNELLARLAASLGHERRLTEEIAHELRTPLARARAEAEISLGSGDVDDLRAALSAIVTDIDELSATVDTLLRSTRAPGPDRARCDTLDAVRAAVAAVRSPVPIEIGLDDQAGGDKWPAVACEEPLLRRIITTQLENATRYAVSTIRVACTPTGDRDVRIEVVDDGPGLDPDETERVFEPGERGQAGEDSPGFGLGLALARRLARSCGGDVTARPGPGGHFLTTLPMG